MDISQNRPWTEPHTSYNCSEKGHILPHCLRLQKKQFRLTATKVNVKGLVAKVVAVALDAQDIAKKAEKVKKDF